DQEGERIHEEGLEALLRAQLEDGEVQIALTAQPDQLVGARLGHPGPHPGACQWSARIPDCLADAPCWRAGVGRSVTRPEGRGSRAGPVCSRPAASNPL